MDKKKILETAQYNRVDERYNSITAIGATISLVSSTILIAFLTIWNMLADQGVLVFGVIITFEIAVFSIYQFIRLPDRKVFLYSSLFMTLLFIVSLVIYLLSIGG